MYLTESNDSESRFSSSSSFENDAYPNKLAIIEPNPEKDILIECAIKDR